MQREESIDAQLRAIKVFARSNGYELISSFIDKAKSGMSDKRCEFQKMINLSDTGKFDAVIVHKLDRFSRDRYDSINYKIKLRSNNIKVISVTEKIDDTPEGELLEGIIESVNQLYSKNLARETLKGLKENAYKAISTGGTPPLGYNFDDNKKLIINENEAEAVRLIFHMYLENYSYPKIINKLNQLGYKTKKNNFFAKNSLYEILKNEKYSGVFVYNKMEGKFSNGKRNSHKSKTESEIIKIAGGCPTIIPKDIFNIAQDKLNSKARTNTNNNNSFYLSGKTFCQLCNSNFYGLSKKNKTIKNYYHYYGCNNNTSNIVDKKCINKLIRQDFIEDQIYNITISTLQSTPSRNKIINTLIDKLKVELNNQHNIEQELEFTKNKINNIMELIVTYKNPS